jgi:pimeloyl-ACP methyl ester carboxylesterase
MAIGIFDICSRVLPKVAVMLPIRSSDVDFLEAGHGPLVVLVHSSVSGARQWRKLIELLARSRHVKAVNLFGYGRTPGWAAARAQTLADQAALIEAVVPERATDVGLVGHSFGASVAMRAAAHLGSRVSRLVLLEPNPFYLLRDNGRMEAFGEAARLRDIVKTHGAQGEWSIAAEEFADYWGGSGTWKATTPDRRATFVEALKPNFHEWDAVMNETTPLTAWSAQLPAKTLIVYDTNTVRPIREIVELMRDATTWQTTTIARGGHMAPLSHPDLVNPIVAKFLQD